MLVRCVHCDAELVAPVRPEYWSDKHACHIGSAQNAAPVFRLWSLFLPTSKATVRQYQTCHDAIWAKFPGSGDSGRYHHARNADRSPGDVMVAHLNSIDLAPCGKAAGSGETSLLLRVAVTYALSAFASNSATTSWIASDAQPPSQICSEILKVCSGSALPPKADIGTGPRITFGAPAPAA